MTEKRFCYCCRVHHAQDMMRPVQTRAGTRWRCVDSIKAAARSVPERDLFGRCQTAQNREAAREQAVFATRLRMSRNRGW